MDACILPLMKRTGQSVPRPCETIISLAPTAADGQHEPAQQQTGWKKTMIKRSIKIVEDQGISFLCYEHAQRPIDADEFRAWAAYAGIDVRSAEVGCLDVLLRDEAEDLLLRTEWLS